MLRLVNLRRVPCQTPLLRSVLLHSSTAWSPTAVDTTSITPISSRHRPLCMEAHSDTRTPPTADAPAETDAVSGLRDVTTRVSKELALQLQQRGQLGDVAGAVSVLRAMGLQSGQAVGIGQYNAILRLLLKKCSPRSAIGIANAMLTEMRREGVEPNARTYTSIISAFQKGKDINGAYTAFAEMKSRGIKPNSWTYTVLMSMCSNVPECVGLMLEMREMGIKPDHACYAALLSAYARAGNVAGAIRTVDEMKEEGLEMGQYVWTSLLTAHARAGDMPGALRLFEQIEQTGTTLTTPMWNALFTAMAKGGAPISTSLSHWARMRQSAHTAPPNARTLVALMHCCRRHPDTATRVFEEAMERAEGRLVPNVYVRSALESAVGRTRARELLGRRKGGGAGERSGPHTMDYMGDGHLNKRLFRLPTNAFEKAITEFLQSGPSATPTLLEYVEDLVQKQGKGLPLPKWAVLFRLLCPADPTTGEALVDMFAQSLGSHQSKIVRRDAAGAVAVLDTLREAGVSPDVGLYRKLIRALIDKQGDARIDIASAQTVLKHMVASGLEPDLQIYNTVMFAYSKAGDPEMAKNLMQEMRSAGVSPDVWTYNSLMAAQTSVEGFVEVMDSMKHAGVDPDTVTYNTLIAAFSRAGKLSAANLLVDEMVRVQIPPNDWTYTTLLSACSTVQECHDVMSNMQRHGVTPNLETYNALLAFYSRRGNVKMVYDTLSEMEAKGLQPNARTKLIVMSAHAYMGEVSRVRELFDDLKLSQSGDLGCIAWNIFFNAYANSKSSKNEVGAVWDEMKLAHTKPTSQTLVSLLKCYRSQPEAAERVFVEMVRDCGVVPNKYVYTCLAAAVGQERATELCNPLGAGVNSEQ